MAMLPSSRVVDGFREFNFNAEPARKWTNDPEQRLRLCVAEESPCCKLATEENLQKISTWNGLFVSVMPRIWSEDPPFREKVKRKEIHW
ncbi:MAG: hypothetical protein ACC628_27285, partial [Pirellulaceae bacterium]